jgi:hypothetical protein
MTIVNDWYQQTLNHNIKEFIEINKGEPSEEELNEIKRDTEDDVQGYFKLISD